MKPYSLRKVGHNTVFSGSHVCRFLDRQTFMNQGDESMWIGVEAFIRNGPKEKWFNCSMYCMDKNVQNSSLF